MNVGLLGRAVFDGFRADHQPIKRLSSVTLSAAEGVKPHDILKAFSATRGNFCERFDNSTHAAVIKLMMMTFGLPVLTVPFSLPSPRSPGWVSVTR